MRVFVMAVAGLMVAAGAQAQQTTQAQQSTQVQQFLQKQLQDAKFALDYGGCPGAFSARRQSPGGMVWTIAREDSASPEARKERGPGVHVALKSAKGALREIELSVSYLAPGARVMPLGPTDPKDGLTKTFELSGNGLKDVEGDLLVGPAFQITSVHLVSATFANGSAWRAENENDCRIEPSRFLPVGAR